jgi:uncharacterized protein
MAVGNAVVHFEVGAAQDAPLVAFYGELFGWGLTGSPGGGYTLIDTRGGRGINGGIGKSRSGEPWSTCYVEVDDLQATLDQASSLGGATVMPVTDHEDESAPSAGPGNPIDWFEVMESDAVDTGTGRGIHGGLGGGQESRWATIYALVADVDETLRRAEELGGSRVTDPSVPVLKSAGRIARYGFDDGMQTGALRDPAGNVLGIYQRRRCKP